MALLFVAAVTVAVAQQRTVRRLRTGGQTVKRWGGMVLILVGGWSIASAIWAEAFARLFPV